jgi:hypothetical protein
MAKLSRGCGGGRVGWKLGMRAIIQLLSRHCSLCMSADPCIGQVLSTVGAGCASGGPA